MDSCNCSAYYNLSRCIQYQQNDYAAEVQTQLDSAMPWVGMYIAAASAACSLAMAADVFNGSRTTKYWFPCKYFSLNAFSLTILAVAIKLPVDLTSDMKGADDKLTRVSSLVFMSIAMSNFMTSMGSMEDNELILNVAALGILVITVAVNVCIRNVQLSSFSHVQNTLAEEVGSTVVMLLLLVAFCCLAFMVPSAKRYIELKYNEMHKSALSNRVEWGRYTSDELCVVVKKYWVMTASGSPQFVIARSPVSVISSVLCLLMVITLMEAHIRMPLVSKGDILISSSYDWSVTWILIIQSIGVALGAIPPLLRWFLVAWFKSSMIGDKSFRYEVMVEAHWTQRLVQFRDSPLPLKIGDHKFRKLLHDGKRLFFQFWIGVQTVIVVMSKLVLLISAAYVKGLKDLRPCGSKRSEETSGHESTSGTEPDYSACVLLLEGEVELPRNTLTNICNEADKLIQEGKKRKHRNLIKLLGKSVSFNGVRQFDNSEVPRLHSQNPPECWSLPIVTLTSIAIALPNILDHKTNQLLSAVGEALYFVKLIEKSLDRNGELTIIRHATDVTWVGVELYKRWHDKDLKETSLRGSTLMESLQNLSDVSRKTVTDFITSTEEDSLMHKPENWPVKVRAANSMYTTTQTILLAHQDNQLQTDDEELFERLSVIISDILAACLTNLVYAITFMCHNNAVKERERSITEAAILLGESEEILETLQHHELPSFDTGKETNIGEWRKFMDQEAG